MLFFSAGSLGARHSIPERIFLRGSFGFCMPGSYAVYVRAAGLQLQIPLPSVLQERFPGSVVEFREILLRQDSVIKKAEYRQGIAGASQIVILTAYIFVECPYALIYVQISFMAGLRFFILQESFEFRQKGTAFTLQGPAYECSGNFLLAFVQFYHTAFGNSVFYHTKIVISPLLYKPNIGLQAKIPKPEYRRKKCRHPMTDCRKLKNRSTVCCFRKESVFFCVRCRKTMNCQLRILSGKDIRSVYVAIWIRISENSIQKYFHLPGQAARCGCGLYHAIKIPSRATECSDISASPLWYFLKEWSRPKRYIYIGT